VRAVAVGLVLMHHAVAFLVPDGVGRIVPGGFVGVDLFFVLSGFLITSLLLEESLETGTVCVKNFYARRGLRLLPALVAVLLATSLDGVIHRTPVGNVLITDAIVFFYSANWFKTFGTDVPHLGHTWSLAVEEQFYLVWPWLLVLALRRRLHPRRAAIYLLGGILMSAVIRAFLWSQAGGDYERVYFRTDARADALLVGAFLALVWRSRWRAGVHIARALQLTAILILAGVAIFLEVHSNWLMYGGFTVVAIASAILIATVLDGSPWHSSLVAAFLGLSVLTHVGRISYGLYLWHVPVYVFVKRLHAPAPLAAFVGVAATFIVAELSMRLVERPFLRLKSRFH
jgi:peptidoglycan/LPS O-acetylase OafA/YrhL